MNWNQSGRDDRQEEKPPYSRLFVVCSKRLREEDLAPIFEKFGKIEDLHIPRDRNTGESKGVAYVKYSKTSSAANAIQDLHMTTIPDTDKPLKVLVASNKNDPQNTNDARYKRIFIKVHKDISETEIRHHFSNYGQVDSVRLQRDRVTDECKGFAYVYFRTFLDAARAVEECDKKYKPIFAAPYGDLKRSRTSLEGYESHSSFIKDSPHYHNSHRDDIKRETDSLLSLIKTKPDNYVSITAKCIPPVPQKFIEKLFNLIPGVTQFKYIIDNYNSGKAFVTFNSEKAAAFAVEKLNNFEYPSGEIIYVSPEYNSLSLVASSLSSAANNLINSVDHKPDLLQLVNVIAQASTLIKEVTSAKENRMDNQDNFCSVPLPPKQPMASINSRVAQRCFIVFKPHPLPVDVLKDAFCRFGDLIDVSTFPKKTFGFAKYASVRAAQEAMRTLHLATVCGVKLKVLEADEKLSKDKTNDDDECEQHSNKETKRIKLHDTDVEVR